MSSHCFRGAINGLLLVTSFMAILKHVGDKDKQISFRSLISPVPGHKAHLRWVECKARSATARARGLILARAPWGGAAGAGTHHRRRQLHSVLRCGTTSYAPLTLQRLSRGGTNTRSNLSKEPHGHSTSHETSTDQSGGNHNRRLRQLPSLRQFTAGLPPSEEPPESAENST